MKKFIKPSFTKIDNKDLKNNTSEFTFAPLSRGFGNTMGNSLRRVILSNIPGLAPFGVEIKNVIHEFSTVTGVVEDVVQIILNLKQLNLKFDPELIEDENAVEIKLVSKKGVVKAESFTTPPGIEIVNKDLVVANTTKDKALEITLYCVVGVGFKSFEENRGTIKNLIQDKKGVIPMDSNFSPINNVNYIVDRYRPGTDSDFEKMNLTIETTGSIEANDVMIMASQYLIAHFNEVLKINEVDHLNEDEVFTNEKVTTEKDHKMMKSIIDLDLSVRSYNALKRMGIETIGELTSKSMDEVKTTKNLGKKSLEEVIEKVADLGLKFRES
jgi:DNA-directed RNA polymerase subunit alpha